jgi:multidrug efflux pump subunit AcrA (membrane-fusion protein)
LLEGTVKTVIADSGSTEQSQRSASSTNSSSSPAPLTFKAIIELARQQLAADGGLLPLAAGMQLSAEIIEDDRTVLEYLLSPVQRIASEAGRER